MTADPWVRPDWRSEYPRGVLDPNGPDGEPIQTGTDRRLLWHLESMLADRTEQRRLKAYLNDTCDHEWRVSEGDEYVPANRQCLWCSAVEWDDLRLDDERGCQGFQSDCAAFGMCMCDRLGRE